MSAEYPSNEPTPSEWDLMHRVAEGDEDTLRLLVQRHQGLLMNFFTRSNVESHAEDLVQETFIRLYPVFLTKKVDKGCSLVYKLFVKNVLHT